ncbi:7200_t:CDS:2 [Ambispora leptoticha]|uniref:7200_t:CDS:1 n=1 Tax=Ambispora leptoticha TaxID=144679 RepID=A0A9N8YY37_9GLOM|nr:7200_t:CDS:2 [Ambispora leptoticha]
MSTKKKPISFFLPLSILSGSFAALASVFAKLFTDTRTKFFAEYLCGSTLKEFLILGCTKDDDSEIGIIYPIRMLCFALIFLCNALMWTFFTKALNASSSSVQVTVVNSAMNFCMTAILGKLIFSEELRAQWWLGALLIVIGTKSM